MVATDTFGKHHYNADIEGHGGTLVLDDQTQLDSHPQLTFRVLEIALHFE